MAFVAPERVDDVLAVAERWEIDARVVGKVTSGTSLRIHHDGELVAEVPAASLTEAAPRYNRPLSQPDWLEAAWADRLDHAEVPDVAEVLLTLLDDPSIASAEWAYQQYDHMLFLNTVVGPGEDGTLLRLKGTDKGLAVSTDGNGRLCLLDPFRGGERLVYEAALNVAVTGAQPMAVVDNLNFGNPEKPEVMWQFRQCIEGISAACEHLGVPVVGGNVSFYNETDGIDIHPTPVVGLLGKAEPMPLDPPRMTAAIDGMELWLFGPDLIDLAGSSFESVIHGHLGGRPLAADPNAASAVIQLAIVLAGSGMVPVLHDVSDGGIAVAVAEVCIRSGIGAELEVSDWRRLFSEAPHRMIAGALPADAERIRSLAGEAGVPVTKLGGFGGESIGVRTPGRQHTVELTAAASAYLDAIPRRMG
jgi:phosphoribosylformylglycinamidine synthase subunit PurL